MPDAAAPATAPTAVPVPAPTAPAETGAVAPAALEVAPEPAKSPETAPAEEKREAARYAALVRKERLVREKQQALAAEAKAKESALAEREAKLAHMQEQIATYEKARGGAKLNPLAALEALGLTYEDVTSFVLADNKPTPDLQVKAVRDEIEALKRQQIEAAKRAEEERAASIEAEKTRLLSEQQAAIEQFHAETAEYVTAHADDYELVNLHEAHGLVVEVIEQHFAQTKRILSAKEAADLVEKHLEEQVEKAISTKRLSEKVKSRFAAPPPAPADEQRVDPAAQRRTVTNDMTASTPGLGPARTEQERIQRALAAMERARAGK